MALSLSVDQLESLPDLSDNPSSSKDGTYSIKCTKKVKKAASDAVVQSRIWFETEPLDATTIGRIQSMQLFAESRDQGWVSAGEAGNWTWFEFAIMKTENEDRPRVQDGIKLVWTSHYNRREDGDGYGWGEGMVFDNNHDMFRSLEPGNVIAVRICARFAGWEIHARTGYLVVKLGPSKQGFTAIDQAPPPYAEIVSQVKNIEYTIAQVNGAIPNIAFQPSLPSTFYRADVFQTTNEPALRVLSLDGGGVRGLSSLYLLRAVMSKMHPNKAPYEVFDMIGGTSTGGLIAIMLGRLKMGIDECIEKYVAFMDKVFVHGWRSRLRFTTQGVWYDEKVLEDAIKSIVKEKLQDEDAPLLDENEKCKIFVMAVQQQADNNRGPVFLRSYTNPMEPAAIAGVKIWQAARATSAAPTYFKSMEIGGVKLVDGGLGANNPLGWLWTEVLGVFGPARTTNCFLSIGTGIASNVGFKDGATGVVSAPGGLGGAATNTELVHILFRNLIDAYAPACMTRKYWRLNVSVAIPETDEEMAKFFGPKNYEEVGELDDLETLPKLLSMTEEYIKAQDLAIDEVSQALQRQLTSPPAYQK